MVDVMWAKPDGSRVLLASAPEVATFVGGIYRFDHTAVVAVTVDQNDHQVSLRAGPLELDLRMSKPLAIFSLRPRPLRRSPAWVRLEDTLFRPLAAPLLLKGSRGVRLHGRSPSGVREWYCIDAYRTVVHATGSVQGRDLGQLRPLLPPARFGFSEFPARPAVVDCAPVLEGAEAYLPGRLTSREAAE